MSTDELLAHLFECYPTLFQTRLDVLNHLFVVLGCGYDWHDGALVDRFGDDRAERDEQDRHLPTGPMADDGSPVDFYPMYGLANLANVPNDAKPEWLALAYEAALALRDRSGGRHAVANREWGERLVKELASRFPGLRRSEGNVT